MKRIIGLAAIIFFSPAFAFAATPTVLDTIPSSGLYHYYVSASSQDNAYTVPSGGQNKQTLAVFFGSAPTDVTLNGATCSLTSLGVGQTLSGGTVSNCAAPTSGTFHVGWGGPAHDTRYFLFTVQDAAQSSPIDATIGHDWGSGSAAADTLTVASNEILFQVALHSVWTDTVSSWGTTQAEVSTAGQVDSNTLYSTSWIASTGSSQTVTTTFSSSQTFETYAFGVKYLAPTAASPRRATTWFP